MSPVFYERSQVNKWLGDPTVAKARTYIDAVSHLRWDNNDSLSAEVQGTQRAPYRVHIHFYDLDDGAKIIGDCSCPVGYNCKHVAATLLAGLEKQMGEPAPGELRPELIRWLEAFRNNAATAEANARAEARRTDPARTHVLAYVLGWSMHTQRHEIQLFKARLGIDGEVRSIDEAWSNVEAALVKPPKFVVEEDLVILRALWLGRSPNQGHFVLRGANAGEVLHKLIATGRLFATLAASNDPSGRPVPLTLGASRPGRIEWQPQADERLRPVLRTEPPSTMVLATEPVWYVDAYAGEAGVVDVSLPFQQLPDYLSMPPISLSEAPLVASVLSEIAPGLPLPPSTDTAAVRVIDSAPMPVLTLDSISATVSSGKYGYKQQIIDIASVSYDYEGIGINADSSATLVPVPGGKVIHLRRRYDAERQRLLDLRKTGLQTLSSGAIHARQPTSGTVLVLADQEAWPAFIDTAVPKLEAAGWHVVKAPGFRYNVIDIDEIDGVATQARDGWFDLEMGIALGERKVRLEPLLANLFRRDKRWLGGNLDTIADDEPIDLATDRQERVRLRAGRLKPVVRVLVDLFDGLVGWRGETPLRVAALDAGRLAGLNDTGRWMFTGDDSIREMARRLKQGGGLQRTPLPGGLHAELREYQQQGLDWMQFLRAHNLAGVLADDMGLGKTVQTLAHILAEKEAGRLDRPALIIVPTTLVHNWRDEAQRFAPDLKVLDLNGPQRKERFEQIGEHELILTTYALLWRDHAALAAHEYHLLILDEAQYVKNATTKAARTIRDLNARHRLCLSGTPLENHLGELWTQFDFLLPGFLGSQKDFTKRWRNPIEKGGDTVRRELLARRIRPFMLRRRKDEVAKELPPKTTIIRSVDLEGSQRDLYETMRTAMQEKVLAAVSAQGLARSKIIVLDALLKLRQVCCDPRLVKLANLGETGAPGSQANADKAISLQQSAKLELLLTMLPELIEEGRRVLLFSQFTGMLALIAEALDKESIPYVILTGDSADRATPVKRFQNGEVPLFLISLKAGGVGLNLTAADTVIHYDPWWNPAAENQATDRAHRLGQDKPVFVYKLIAAGSIEEKIVELQEKKAALADNILSEDAAGSVKFSDDDLDALFAPMPEMDRAG
ncbi:DEAD/DEAH box helicase [Paraburkholderia sp.]|uniref:DEAD/DEAH box helicase n=1 Tax=Paraburkholderia sp. TaxID=1926495 RepID=UPI0023921B55|nr:DEAD/DEAH box helicase [Paraburkholderia sp.]MDE1182540.1 DEAD/DEAH box helicase [Paraburkholderia sp.]